MKKLLLFLLLFLVNKNAGVAQNHEISGGVGGMFIKNAQISYDYTGLSQNIFEIKDNNGNKIKTIYQITHTKDQSVHDYTLKQSTVANLAYNYRFPYKRFIFKVGVAYSFWKQSYTNILSDKVGKISYIDTVSQSINLGNVDYKPSIKIDYKGSILNLGIPIELIYPVKTWELGIGARINIPLLFQQEKNAYVNDVFYDDIYWGFSDIESFYFSKFEIGKIGASVNTSISKWFHTIGFEIGANKSFHDVLKIEETIIKSITAGLPPEISTKVIHNKPIQAYCKIIKRF